MLVDIVCFYGGFLIRKLSLDPFFNQSSILLKDTDDSKNVPAEMVSDFTQKTLSDTEGRSTQPHLPSGHCALHQYKTLECAPSLRHHRRNQCTGL